jgi:RNA polymerase-binding transcription factor DksA
MTMILHGGFCADHGLVGEADQSLHHQLDRIGIEQFTHHQRSLRRVDHALHQMGEGRYGTCCD